MKEVAYHYKNLQIPGGGYVTGFLFHPTEKNILYLRTDIGGSYKYEYDTDRWHSLTESVTMFDLRETFPIALCTDDKKPSRLLIVSGINQADKKGKLSISDDYGKSFRHLDMPCFVHGNLNGRGTGYRMVTDPANDNGLYFASQRDGLYYSPDLGQTWEQRATGNEKCMTCVWVSPTGQTVVAGTAGVTTGTKETRGHSLFAFKELDKPCENSFSDENGNRYITCINADFSDENPETVIVTPRGNWKGKTKGGLIISRDYGQSFERISLPFGISDYLDERFRMIETPNVNSGWVALSSNADTIVYGVAEGIDLFMKGIIVSNNLGKTFRKVMIFDTEGNDISDSSLHMKVFSDRVNPDVFYGFGDDYSLYISTDKGNHFMPLNVSGFPERKTVFGLIDCANKTEIRGEAGKEGVFYLSAYENGLWKLHINIAQKTATAIPLTKEGESVFAMGLGLLREGGNYAAENKALYIAGEIDGLYGFFRSEDDGKSWVKINNEMQH